MLIDSECAALAYLCVSLNVHTHMYFSLCVWVIALREGVGQICMEVMNAIAFPSDCRAMDQFQTSIFQ